MSWLNRFEDDMVALEKARSVWATERALQGTIGSLVDDAKDEDGYLRERLSESVWDKYSAAMWDSLGPDVIESEKASLAIQMRLVELYERLRSASDEEWEAYARAVLGARVSVMRDQWAEVARRLNAGTRKDRELMEQKTSAGSEPPTPLGGGPERQVLRERRRYLDEQNTQRFKDSGMPDRRKYYRAF